MEPLASPDDCLLAEQIAKADPKVCDMLKQRGVSNMDLVACDPWSGIPIGETVSGPPALEPACMPLCLHLTLERLAGMLYNYSTSACGLEQCSTMHSASIQHISCVFISVATMYTYTTYHKICIFILHAVHMVPCEGRLIQLWMYYRNGDPDDNHYAHPLDFIPVVDLNLKKVWLPT